MRKTTQEIPHEPLFVLRQHRSPVLSCSFYPTNVSSGRPSLFSSSKESNEPQEMKGEPRVSTPFISSYLRSNFSSSICSSTYAHYFLSGDVDGVCILWDLRSRKPLMSFKPSVEAGRQRTDPRKELDGIPSYGTGNLGVLSVGFFPSNIIVKIDRFSQEKLEFSTDNHEKKGEAVDYHTGELTIENENKAGVGGLNAPFEGKLTKWSVPVGTKEELVGGRTGKIGLIQRFGLHRRFRTSQNSASLQTTSSFAPSAGIENLNESKNAYWGVQPISEGGSDVNTPCSLYFYTQCRNQELYIWEFSIGGDDKSEGEEKRGRKGSEGVTEILENFSTSTRPSESTSFNSVLPLGNPSLLYVLGSPQCGFCQVSCAYTYEWRWASDLSLPIFFPQKNEWKRKDCWVYEILFSSYFSIPQEGPDGVIHLWCARFATDMFSMNCSTSFCSSTGIRWTRQSHFLSSSFRLVLTPLHSQRHSRGFSLSHSFNGGMIMSVDMCRNGASLAGAFESGHVSLFQYRCTSEKCGIHQSSGFPHTLNVGKNCEETDENATSTGLLSSCSFEPHVLAVLRVFPEPCVSCAWEADCYWWKDECKRSRRADSGRPYGSTEKDHPSVVFSAPGCVVVAASAEGMVHCYRCAQEENVISPKIGERESSIVPLQNTLREWSLSWTLRLSKGIGQLHIQGEVVVIGCWDSTVRLLSLETGKVMSILPHHREAVNGLSLCGATLYYMFPASRHEKRCASCFSASFSRFSTVEDTKGIAHSNEVLESCHQLTSEDVGEIISETLFRGAAKALTSFGFDIHYMRSGGRVEPHECSRGSEASGGRNTKPSPSSFLSAIPGTEFTENGTNFSFPTDSGAEGNETCLHFASASKDLTIALWNIDFNVLRSRWNGG